MESNYNNRDFEQFVKQNADQYRMFPSEKVWKGIHNTLHTRKRWYGIAFALLLLTSGAVSWIMLSPSGKNQQVPDKSSIISQNNNVAVSNKKIQTDLPAPFAQSIKRSIPFIANSDDQQKDIFLSDIAGNLTADKEDISTPVSQNKAEIITEAVPAYNKVKEPAIFKPVNVSIAEQVIDNNPDMDLNKNTGSVITGNKPAEKKDIYPLSIESVVNSFKHISKRKKLFWQVYFAPTISYRKLSENKAFLSSPTRPNNSIYNYSAIYDINSVVTHKPDLGLELGFNAGYPIGKNLKIIAGLQLNVSKYDIKAVTYPSEVATIALTSGSGSSSVSTMTTYRNFDGNTPDWLHNLYVSASAPIGLELKLTGNKNTYLGVGGTVQPTYILGDRAYLISTDYKNYAEVPSLVRKWNISTSFETFAGYSTGKIKWKVGPQVRYQMRSSFLEKYPFKEHLFDFGLKVGVMLNK